MLGSLKKEIYVNKKNLNFRIMRTEFGEKLEKAINSVESFTWKTKDGNVIKLVDAPAENLIK